ncbi:MAG: hypothetical protein RMJ43_10865 [Chloroherpetonaceae bacterium]|nr:hypothetical protein [Chthonomonadaceae bacterium]MDW8208329.1 hypothetical protein [Chloroherpetonaceae bacterium]
MSLPVVTQSPTLVSGILDSRLRAAGRRIRIQIFLNHTAPVLCITVAVALLAIAMDTLGLPMLPWPILAGIVLVIGLSGAAIAALVRPLPPLQVARIVEHRAGLQERLSSALAFTGHATRQAALFYAAQRADAERHAAQLNLRHVLPLSLPKIFWPGALSLLLLSLTTPLQRHPFFQSPQQKQEAVEVRQQGTTLLRLADATEQQASRAHLARARRAAQETRRLGASMRRNQLSRKEALVRMRALTEQIARAHRQAAQQASSRSLERAADTFRKSLEQTQAEIRASRQQFSGSARDLSDTLTQMHRALQAQNPQAMQQTMNHLADLMQTGRLAGAQQQMLQQALQALAGSLNNTGMPDAVRQLQALARQLRPPQDLSPETQTLLASQMRQIGQCMGRCPNPGTAQAEAAALKQLLDGVAMSRMQLGMGVARSAPDRSTELVAQQARRGVGSSSARPGRGHGIGSGSTQTAGQPQQERSSRTGPLARISGKRSGIAPDLQVVTSGTSGDARARIPYYQAYLSSRQSAEAVMDREAIPAAYREQVRAYFESIRP